MRRKIIILSIFASIMVLLCFGYCLFTVRIKLEINTSKVGSARVYVAGQEAYTTNENEILQIISAINKNKYYKGKNLKIYSKDPDAYVSLYDVEGNRIENISFYGDVAIHNYNYDDRYGIMLFTYQHLENICKKINEK